VKVTWSRTDGGSIRLGTRIQLHDFNFRLQISQLEHSDEGLYSCSGSNSAGSTPFSLQLRVDGIDTASFLFYETRTSRRFRHQCFNKSSAVAETGDHLATIYMGRKEGAPLSPFPRELGPI